MQNAIRRLMHPDDMLETFSELAVREPDLMRLVLQASMAALVNAQSVEPVDAEMKRRAVQENGMVVVGLFRYIRLNLIFEKVISDVRLLQIVQRSFRFCLTNQAVVFGLPLGLLTKAARVAFTVRREFVAGLLHTHSLI